jgi:chromosome segregation ATPase
MDLEKAFQVDGQHAKVMTSNCVVSSELLDFKRKLEIKTTDLLWKDRESAGYQTELKKWRKECKAVGVELSASKEYSEQLLQKLSTAQALIAQQAASLKSVEAAIELTEKLKKSEASLTATTRKSRTLEAEVKSLRDKPPPPSQEELKRLHANLKKYKVSENTLKTELVYLHAQLETSQLKNKNFELEIEELRKAMEISNSMELLRTSLMTENHISMTEKEQIIADLKEEVEQLEFTTCACREENINLLEKLEKLSTDYANLQSDNKSSVRKLENELDHIKEVVKDLEYTAKDREEIYCAMTDETVTLRSNLQVATANLANFTALAIDTKEMINADKASIKVLKNSILRLRNQNQELKLQIYQIKDTPLMKERELINLHHLAASAMKERQEIQETVGHERKLRKAAEGTISSLNSEISYLQKQLEQTAELRMTWIDQKLVLKAEVSALYQSNKLLRKRVISSDRCPTATQTHTVDRMDRNRISSSGSTGDISSISAKCPNSNGLLNDSYLNHRDHHLIDANENEESVNANTVFQKKAEKAVERAMFDIICAFSSASDLPATKKKKLQEDAGIYDVRQTNNGLYEVYFKSNNNNNSSKNDSSSIDAEELMNDLQISEFMKLHQNGSKVLKESFPFSLFAEKLATILNYHRYNVHTVYQQLLAVRMENTALLSRATNVKARLNTAKRLLIQEKAWKQVRCGVALVFIT